MEKQKNTLLKNSALPAFSKMQTKDMFNAIKYLVNENKAIVKKTEKLKNPTWDNFVYQIENSDDKISKVWAPIRHLNSVMNDKDIRKQYGIDAQKKFLDYFLGEKVFRKFVDTISS